MATKKQTGASGQAAALPDVGKLRDTLKTVDGLSQGAFSEIASLAQMALKWVEGPEERRHPELIAATFRTIWDLAGAAENAINAEAEAVGCHYVKPDQLSRVDARNGARELGAV